MHNNLNKKYKKINIVIILIMLMIVSLSSNMLTMATEIYTNDEVSYEKMWKITFSGDVDISNIDQYVYTVNVSGNKVKNLVEYGQAKNQLLVYAPDGGYKFGNEYILVIKENLKSISGQVIGERIQKKFKIESMPKIENLSITKNLPVEGEAFDIIINTDKATKVQYFSEIINDTTGFKASLMNSYSDEVYGNNDYGFNFQQGLPMGEYTLRAYVKRAYSKGINDNDGIDYDDVRDIKFKVISSNQNTMLNKIQLTGAGVTQLNEKYYIKTGSTVDISVMDRNIVNATVNIYDSKNVKQKTMLINTGKTSWKPEGSGDYKLEIIYNDENQTKGIIYVTVGNIEIKFVDYNMTVQEFTEMQMNDSMPRIDGNGIWRDATFYETNYYLNPNNFIESNGIYQFLTLNYADGMTVDDANKALEGKGILEGKGQAFLQGAKKYNVNPAYLIAHALLETGNGTSKLATGIKVDTVDGQRVEPKTTYNMYGIQAVDQDPNGKGSQYAYKQGWFTPELAISEGAKWIGQAYINSPQYNQNTLYKMRWNKDVIWHQYASDVAWASNQVNRIKKLTDMSSGLKLVFEIPKFKELP